MIVKTTRMKKADYGRLIKYILEDKGRIQDVHSTFTIYHNLLSTNFKEVVTAFKENDRYRRQQKRKNAVRAYHEILSFSSEDYGNIVQTDEQGKQVLNEKMLEDIAYTYIDIRNINALCVAKAHIHQKNIHLHFCFSANEFMSERSLRMDNKEFKRVRLSIEQHQIEKYPSLSHSIVYVNKKEKKRNMSKEAKHTRKERSLQRKKRLQKAPNEQQLTQKEILQQEIQSIAVDCKTLGELTQKLEERAYTTYQYRNKTRGIVATNPKTGKSRKYRFSTLLANEKEKFAHLIRTQDRLQQTDKINLKKLKRRTREKSRGRS